MFKKENWLRWSKIEDVIFPPKLKNTISIMNILSIKRSIIKGPFLFTIALCKSTPTIKCVILLINVIL